MIQLNQVHLQLGTKVLLDSTDLTIFPGQKWGLIGANGSGKTSLFKLFLGGIHEDAGQISIPKGWQLSHMGQETAASSRAALQYILDGDQEFRRLQKAIAESKDGESLAHLYEKFEGIDGYRAESRAQQLLHGLGFDTEDDQRPVKDFSGGWRIRLNLAKALMCRSDLLLLDEPTNHLDMDATFWLENWLDRYSGTLVIVSHDRDFLDNVVDNVVNIEKCKLVSYSGNYSSYEMQKAERLAQQMSVYKKQQARVAEIEDFVRRFRAKATKAKQAQSRLKELQRMERVAPAHVESPFSFRFPAPEKLPDVLLNLSSASVGYSANAPLVHRIELSILKSSRIGLLGGNGAGKSTLIKSLAAEIPLLNGDRSEGNHLKIGYFAQHQLEALDLDASCALHLQRLSPNASDQKIRNFLGSFGFSNDRALESIRYFSGGEKARLALAIIAWQKPNLLLLDEPTNHLDLEMRHALEIALQDFEGAIVVVSHDRHLLKNTVDSFLLVDNGQIILFDGTLDDYQQWLNEKNKGFIPVETPTSNKNAKKEKRQAAAAAREKLKPLANTIKTLEKAIGNLHNELNGIEEQLSNDTLYEDGGEHLETLLNKQNLTSITLQQKEEEWVLKSEEHDALKHELGLARIAPTT